MGSIKHPAACIYIYIYIYIYGIRPICRLHFGQHFQNFPSFIVKNGPEKMDSKTCASLVVLKSSFFPPKRVNNVASTKKSRQQTGLKAHIYIYISWSVSWIVHLFPVCMLAACQLVVHILVRTIKIGFFCNHSSAQ